MSDSAPASESASAKQRLWVVSELYYPEETSTGYYMTRIAEDLAAQFDVKVISGQPTYSARGTISPDHEVRRKVEIFRAKGTTLDKNVLPYRMLNMVTLGISAFWIAVRKFRAGDRVLVVTTPPTMPFIIAGAALARGAAYILLIHDNYPEILVAAGKASESSFFVRLMQRANRWLYKHAARIIVVGRDMRELVSRKADGLDVPIHTIPNWAELETVNPEPRCQNKLLAELGLSEKFVVLYAGNMGPPNDLESVVEAAERLMADDRVHFIFLGSGMKRKWLEAATRDRSLTNVTILAPRPRSEQVNFLNACDVSLVSLVDKMWGVSVPSRTYNILASGKPMIAIGQAGSEVARVVEEEAVGWVVPPSSPGMLAAAITEALGSGDRLAEMGRRARKAAEEKYSQQAAIEKYRKAIC
jgi:colanic acid biosynthesis glycosyl transferase WcaI